MTRRKLNVGEKYGRLIIIKEMGADPPPNSRDTRRRRRYLCKCECGDTAVVRGDYLRGGETQSCGCFRRETAVINVKPAYIKNFAEGTNIPSISANKPMKNNTSGTRGVCWYKHQNKWAARITFKGKDYYLGSFVDKKDAIEARKEAEERLFKGFLKWYNNRGGSGGS